MRSIEKVGRSGIVVVVLSMLLLVGCASLGASSTKWPVPTIPSRPSLEYGFVEVNPISGGTIWLMSLEDKRKVDRYIFDLEESLREAEATIRAVNGELK